MIPLPPPLTFSILGDDEDQDDDDDGWRDGGEGGGGIDHRRPNAARFPISREEKEAKKCNFLFGTSFPVWPIDKDTSSLFVCTCVFVHRKLSQAKKKKTN